MPHDPADFPSLSLAAPDGARAQVYLHGAHVTSWTPAGGGERLFLSARSALRPDRAIRGGVPVIFPQFSEEGPLPRHGFARTARWERVDGDDADPAEATLRLRDSDQTRAIWPHAFDVRLTVRVGGPTLELTLAVLNTGGAPLAFTGALHTYLRVADVRDVRVEGLAGVRYRDQTAGGAVHVEDASHLRLTGATDRVYLDAPATVTVREPAGALACESEGFPDVVLWNPWAEGAAGLADMEAEGWRRMLCVEAAAVGAPVRVTPGARWTGRQRLRVVGRGEAG